MKRESLRLEGRKIISACAAFLLLFAGTAGSADVLDPWCDPTTPSFEQPIKTALGGEAEAMNLASSVGILPIPIPRTANTLKDIARLFNQVGLEVITARSHVLSVDFVITLTIPEEVRKALNAQEQARHLTELLGYKITGAWEKGLIGENGYDTLMLYQETLESQIETLPIPIP